MIRDIQAFVHYFCNRMLWFDISKEDKEDICQDALTQVVVLMNRKGDVSDAMVARKVQWAIRESIHKKFKKAASEAAHERTMDKPRDVRTIESRITKKDLTLQVKTLLYALGKKKRRAVNYYYLKGMNIQETARRMKTSPATAWRLVQEGVAELRDAFAEYHPYGVYWKV